jgi:hypothetical protein
VRLKNFVLTEEVAVELVTQVGELGNTSRGENGAKGDSLGAKLIIEAAMPQTNPVRRVAGPPFGSKRRPLIEVTVNEREVTSTNLA